MVVHFPASYVRLPRRVPKDLKKSPEIRSGKAQRTTPVVELQELGEPEIQKAGMSCENPMMWWEWGVRYLVADTLISII